MVPFITIELDKPRTMRLTMKAAIEFEKTNKVKLADMGDEMTMDICAKLAYTMMKKEDPGLTLEKTIELLDEYTTLGEALKKVAEAIKAAFPENSTNPNADPPKE